MGSCCDDVKTRPIRVIMAPKPFQVLYFPRIDPVNTTARMTGSITGTSGSGKGNCRIFVGNQIIISLRNPVRVAFYTNPSDVNEIYIDAPAIYHLNNRTRPVTAAFRIPHISHPGKRLSAVTKIQNSIWRLKISDRESGVRMFDAIATPGQPSVTVGTVNLL
ncbi:hypothetical protein [Marininema halotolerans]|uniref:Uncharacterized protein n=1 Tax=Marininema halotolerans TaxID=1155944 RepID=A0A1I6SIX3_9BACL|nr:hypothetical protein [Marininema halotolerans]SFS76912.1 hypothetical protein SAMN05444972_107129 [Marininema halotolerans]